MPSAVAVRTHRYFVRKSGKKVTGVARMDEENARRYYEGDPEWTEVTKEKYEAARAAIWIP
jgi:hypothetical protein